MADYRLSMKPASGKGQVLSAGEILRVTVEVKGDPLPSDARVLLRTDLNSAPAKRQQILQRVEQGAPRFTVGWHDVPMRETSPNSFEVELIAFQPGYYELKAHLDIGEEIWWPSGDDASVAVHPLKWRGRNAIYCAFPRQFGPYKHLSEAKSAYQSKAAAELEEQNFTVIPPSGTLADLEEELPFLFHELGVRILHLLPVQETPTHYARMGRFGSPYASADMRSVNHAYCVFRPDRTPDEHFQEFCAQVHAYGGDVLLDLAVNHLGWSTELLNDHPEWFMRKPDGHFVSPGAWGTIWEDLVELDFDNQEVWRYLAESLVLWCDRGVDGFRADAGYQVPLKVWEYVTAKVHDVYPDTLFLLEGLGGAWEVSEAILKKGGMQWAYSEMFQQDGLDMLHGYLRHLDRCCTEVGVLANYAETHDNPRLALDGEQSVRMRLALCALTSSAGAFGFTNGVEWLATEKVDVHGSSGLRWGHPQNVIPWIRQLTDLLKRHPIFHGSARIFPIESLPPDVLAFRRQRDDEQILVILNLHPSQNRSGILLPKNLRETSGASRCVLTGRGVDLSSDLSLAPLEVLCLDLRRPEGPAPAEQMLAEIQAAEEELRLRAILGELWGESFPLEGFGELLGAVRARGLKALLAAAALGRPKDAQALAQKVRDCTEADLFLGVSVWNSDHGDRLHILSAEQFLYLEEEVPFRVRLVYEDGDWDIHTFEDFGDRRFVAFARARPGSFTIEQSRLDRVAGPGGGEPQWLSSHGPVRCFAPESEPVSLRFTRDEIVSSHRFLLTNEMGSYTLLPLAPHTVYSKYDALLAVNLHPSAPDERRVLLKRTRIYLLTPMISYPLTQEYLVEFRRWPWPTWIYEYVLPEGKIRIQEQVQLSRKSNCGRLVLMWDGPALKNHEILVRPDVEFRGHHGETKAHAVDEARFAAEYSILDPETGMGFRRSADAKLEFVVQANSGQYTHSGEWFYGIPHRHEATRGQIDSGDAFSPGYFKIPLDAARSSLRVEYGVWPQGGKRKSPPYNRETETGEPQQINHILRRAAGQFIVKRGALRTVLAGYPWFLDWGRDTFIAARGYLAEGHEEVVRDLAFAFAALAREGTLPNALSAENDTDRDTSDAPLWFLKVVEELSEIAGWEALLEEAGSKGVRLADTVRSICEGYLLGTPNAICCDKITGLVYSPSHFTWMDTNFPAATPREGYPIEIQALWIRALEFAAKALAREDFAGIAEKARKSFSELFWMSERGAFADCLSARSGAPASLAARDESLRPNQLYAVALGIARPEHARNAVVKTYEHLLVPAGLRSVANLRLESWPWIDGASPPLGMDPVQPYRGRYEGDEDTSRKLAYHNGTAWAHLLPLWVEALLVAFPGDPRAFRLGRVILRTYEPELRKACVGQISEVFDGDLPHENRGCCAQAWAVTEFLRVWGMVEGQ